MKDTKSAQAALKANKARDKATRHTIEQMQVARATKGFEPDWNLVSSSRSLSLRDLLSVIYALFDRASSPRPLPRRNELISGVEAALEAERLEPHLLSLMEWCDYQGYKLFPPPTGTRGRYKNSVASNKLNLQRDAEGLAEKYRQQGSKIPSKAKIAAELLELEEYAHLEADVQTIARNLSVTWK